MLFRKKIYILSINGIYVAKSIYNLLKETLQSPSTVRSNPSYVVVDLDFSHEARSAALQHASSPSFSFDLCDAVLSSSTRDIWKKCIIHGVLYGENCRRNEQNCIAYLIPISLGTERKEKAVVAVEDSTFSTVMCGQASRYWTCTDSQASPYSEYMSPKGG